MSNRKKSPFPTSMRRKELPLTTVSAQRKNPMGKTNSKTLTTGKREALKTTEQSKAKQAARLKSFPIVGIGASAGGLEAFTQLLEALPMDTGMAFILIQHLDPKHESLAPEILSRTTRMPVHEVEDGMRVLPDHVYLIPPNFNMALLHGVLSLLPRTETRGQHMAIDFFFQSLALDQKGSAIGVILSGTASDGSAGLKVIKAEGGITVVQDPKSAKYDGMPKSAIASGIVDLILPPEGIAQELTRISKHPYIANAFDATPQAEADDHCEVEDDARPDDALRRIFVLLRTHTQVDFSNYKHTTLKRRIERRMVVRKTESLEAYAKYLQDNPIEVKALYGDILIHVTAFFRDSDSFKALTDRVFPQLMKNRAAGAAIRIWVPGCSSGEEVYSLAILLLEFLGDAGAKTPIQIFATDISESAIQKARAGVYAESIERVVSKERLNRFFDKVEGAYKINKAIRDLCLFSRHDVTRDPPFAKLDLVSCRNVLIYFELVLQKQVIPIFHYALNPGGFLWLGKSEGPGGASNLFALLDKTHKIYSKTNIPTPMGIRFPLSTYVPEVEGKTPQASAAAVRGGTDFQRDADRVALSKAPPSVVVNADMEILQFRGRTVPYLEPASGLTSNNLFKMARQELLPGLRLMIQTAKKQNTQARLEGLSFEVDDKRRTVNIEVIPANPLAAPRQRNFVIFFEEVSSTPLPEQAQRQLIGKLGNKKGQVKNVRDKQNERIIQLEQDALAAKLFQQSITEEFEATQEELTSANEELQSTNEELQSTNEGMETAKEELQSSNEELTTVNDELQNRNTDLTVLSGDLNNLLSSVEIPIVIVGNDHRIRRFTPKAEKIFNLIPGDVGRPIGNLKPSFDLDLDALVSEVTESLGPQQKEIQNRQGGRWMRLQIRPYKTIDNRIDGAVITVMDIETLKQQIKGEKDTRVSAETAKTRSDFLAEASKILASSLEYELTFERVASLAVPSLADWCTVFDSSLRRLAIAHVDPSKLELIREMDRRFPYDSNKPSVLEKTMRLGRSELIPEITDELLNALARSPEHLVMLKNIGMRSSLVVPLMLRGASLGVLALASRELGYFTEADQSLAEELALRAATAIDNAHLYQEAQESVRAREAILGVVSHDLKNPVSAIQLSTQLLARLTAQQGDPKITSIIQRISGSTEQMTRLIGDLLDFSKIQNGKLSIEEQLEEPGLLVASAFELMKAQAESKGLAISKNVNPDLPHIQCDKQRVLQVFSNLLGNAIKFTSSGGSIQISAVKDDDGVRFSVKDTGPGISEDEIPKVFEKFWQARNTKSIGAGLGLSIVRGIIEGHGGKIWVESHVGVGSTFHFTLPINAATSRRERGGGGEVQP